ncbi:iron-containing alcohol dehydrogenase [Mesosutterella sp. OilRF-GAM-744-9]|uniref:Iron-containing alcohol dehydrogenase n=2 Tax=Mesosutterella TaxID=2494213 RepID=A0ABS9MTL5_9BURK|nr:MULTISPECIES: iron-containing alcohol dehydrogenase [unclassified Mesosutterella]MCG5031961.1 iron-containing alcohol dehydrogenase [Mesosutterella sp. oilRF-744-WT-GAM-9]MDL2059605.1 iron-containing alcohol dehydrogenase [Mesosutterella sp. AGMB02718]
MQNFNFCSPTQLVFGKGCECEIGNRLAERFPGGRVMMVYGGGSIRRSGLYDRVMASLRQAGLQVREKGGVHPNPDIGFVRDLIAECRNWQPDVLLAVGGGSVIDTAKAAAMGVPYEGDVWDFFCGKAVCTKALPIAVVLTIPAAGSELSMRVVITNEGRKWGTASQAIRSYLSVIDPELFFTLPAWQAAAGVVDMMSHIMERYLTNTTGTGFVDAQAEAAMKTIMKYGRFVHKFPQDYDAWSQIGLAGTFAHNGFFGLGQEEDWACHGIEHELSAWKPEITHGAGLAVVTPGYLSYVARRNPARILQWARNVMEVDPELDESKAVAGAVASLRDFYKSLGMPLTLRELGAGDAPIEQLAERAVAKGPLGHYVPLKAADVAAILRSVL